MSVPFSVTLENLTVAKAAPGVRTVTGWAAVVTRDDGVQVIDSDDHVIPVTILKHAVQDAFAEMGPVDVNHEGGAMSSLVESFVVTKENRKALGLGDSGREGWIATLRVTDPETIKRIDSGELSELSLKGTAQGEWV